MVEMMLAPSSKRVASRPNQSFSFLLLSVVISLCFDWAKAFFHTDKQTFKPREMTAAGAVAKLLRFFGTQISWESISCNNNCTWGQSVASALI